MKLLPPGAGWALIYNELYGLDVTEQEAEAIRASRPWPELASAACFRVSWPREGRVRLSLRVTPTEGDRIEAGREPLAVLLPRYRARSLTVAEMMA